MQVAVYVEVDKEKDSEEVVQELDCRIKSFDDDVGIIGTEIELKYIRF